MSPAYTGRSLFPPSFDGDGLSYMWAVFGLMTVVLLCSEWLWRTLWAFRELPRPIRHPLTVLRSILSLLLFAILLGAVPDLILIMMWPELSPAAREMISVIDRRLDGCIGPVILLAWLISRLGTPMVEYQLIRLPVPINLWPDWAALRRPVWIGFLVLLVSAAVTFLR